MMKHVLLLLVAIYSLIINQSNKHSNNEKKANATSLKMISNKPSPSSMPQRAVAPLLRHNKIEMYTGDFYQDYPQNFTSAGSDGK